MAFIPVQEHLPGVTGLLEFRPDTAGPIRELTQFLLRGPNTLAAADRELIATVVSNGNQCVFCTTAHKAVADKLLGENKTTEQVLNNIDHSAISPKLKALLHIAVLVRKNGNKVTSEDIDKAKSAGATDFEIHDTVLIAALFCLYNRYVDGLRTDLPENAEYYNHLTERLTTNGYVRLPQGYNHLKT